MQAAYHEHNLMVQGQASTEHRSLETSLQHSLSYLHQAISRGTLLSTTVISLALSPGSVRLVVHRALGVGAEVLERALGRLLGLFGAAGDTLVVGVVGSRAGLGAGLALGLGGLAALVGGGHGCDCFGWVWLGLGCVVILEGVVLDGVGFEEGRGGVVYGLEGGGMEWEGRY